MICKFNFAIRSQNSCIKVKVVRTFINRIINHNGNWFVKFGFDFQRTCRKCTHNKWRHNNHSIFANTAHIFSLKSWQNFIKTALHSCKTRNFFKNFFFFFCRNKCRCTKHNILFLFFRFKNNTMFTKTTFGYLFSFNKWSFNRVKKHTFVFKWQTILSILTILKCTRLRKKSRFCIERRINIKFGLRSTIWQCRGLHAQRMHGNINKNFCSVITCKLVFTCCFQSGNTTPYPFKSFAGNCNVMLYKFNAKRSANHNKLRNNNCTIRNCAILLCNTACCGKRKSNLFFSHFFIGWCNRQLKIRIHHIAVFRKV